MENPFEIILERLDKIEQQLSELNKKMNISAVDSKQADDLMNVTSLAEYLDLSVSTLYGMTCRRELPTIKRGKRLYFKKSEIDEWLYTHRRKTMEEIEIEAQTYVFKNRRY